MEPITRCGEIGPGSKTLSNTKIISNINVIIERIKSITTVNGLGLNALIQLNTINKNGIIENKSACFLSLDKAKIPAVRNSIQKILSTIIKKE